MVLKLVLTIDSDDLDAVKEVLRDAALDEVIEHAFDLVIYEEGEMPAKLN